MVNRSRRGPVDIEKLKSAAKMPPAAPEIEQYLLGSLLLDNALFAKLNLHEGDGQIFFDKKHRTIYEEMYHLFTEGIPIDAITLYRQLEKAEKTDEAGGAVYLAKLTEDISSSANAQYHLAIIKEKWAGREIISTAMNAADRAYSNEDPYDIAQDTIQKLSRIDVSNLTRVHIINDYSTESLKNFEALVERKGAPLVSMGYEELDEITHGARPGEMTVFAARSTHGKTTLALNVAYKIAKPETQNRAVLYFSYEAGAEALIHKLWAMRSGLESKLFRYSKGEYTQEIIDKTHKVVEEVKSLKIIIDTESRNYKSVVASVTAAKSMYPELSMVFFDNIQNFNTHEQFRKDESVYKELAQVLFHDITQNKSFGVHTTVLNQIDDWVDVKKINKYQIPTSATDLADDDKSGISKLADNVIFLTQPGLNFSDATKAPGVLKDKDYFGKVFLINFKTRNNELARHTMIPLEFQGATSRILSFSPQKRKEYTIELDV